MKIHNINPGYNWNSIFLSSPFWHILCQTHYRLTCAEKSWNTVLSELWSYPRQTLFNDFTNWVYHRWLFIFTFPHWERGSVTWTHCYYNVAICLPCKYTLVLSLLRYLDWVKMDASTHTVIGERRVGSREREIKRKESINLGRRSTCTVFI